MEVPKLNYGLNLNLNGSNLTFLPFPGSTRNKYYVMQWGLEPFSQDQDLG
jgi:hypothetical protein